MCTLYIVGPYLLIHHKTSKVWHHLSLEYYGIFDVFNYLSLLSLKIQTTMGKEFNIYYYNNNKQN
ncbi:hypothetical protein PFAG_01215 [Plasmodium falciparum Santa Lucia]|uniref:Uncharacterized protein n=6 Tax=Plasmodium falciparum TaxID=5833 RepID=A0A024XB03_PLAFC|nr:hypothetical protein PFFVO_01250 [Plasmodium falciparum Vietnam Oak-Knoll (FVO)]ETW44098.1 hypothetical protein PFNF135_01351 [Plasmodium falciparum NF135/5.C10]ETW50545.1 hypothetical protein PFMALIP_01273 [Plasmodium falciparum MaliPS096_E11]ETW62747.1 hypothetical protein PFMC_01268 [Plasmodium falciparum CAMP/Malaysia]EUR75507.1 hypothetical protein PFBG_01250 [Plasmodium falciparum 7G8]EUT90013.1 hypothetical protein PFAG_01215 [Plasmodium falciparum Santa Lucia]